MIKNNLKLALRRLSRDSVLTFINISGLAIGMTCSILIMLWVRNEVTYDKFHEDADQIYRVELNNFQEGVLKERSSITQIPIGPALTETFPEIESFVRFRGPSDSPFNIDGKSVTISNVFFADSGFFDVFSFGLIEGNPATALRKPNSVVLTRDASNSIFGDKDPIGEMVVLNGSIPLQITGIISSPPDNSHIKYQALISFPTQYPLIFCQEWDCNYSYYTYIKLVDGVDVENLQSKFPDFMWEPINKKISTVNFREDIALRPISEIHLYSKSYEMEQGGSLQMIYLFSAISAFIIILACINFINLTTAQVSKRGVEIGIKKVSGASRKQLIHQIISEISIQALLALVIAVILIEVTLPAFNGLLGKSLSLSYSDFTMIFGLLIILAISILLSGIYPALVLTRLNPASVMKKNQSGHVTTSGFRNILVIVQFFISISLIACTIIVYDQLKYVGTMDLGFTKENVVNVPLRNNEIRDSYQTLMTEFGNLAEVIDVGASSEVPGHGFTQNGYIPEGITNPIMIQVLSVDETFLETLDIKIIEGRNFIQDMASDKEAFILNQTLVDYLGWEDPIGKVIERNGIEHPVIGVVKDFHFTSAHAEITPLVINIKPWEGVQSYGNISVRIKSSDISRTLAGLESTWKKNVPSLPFEYEFLDERFGQLYRDEARLGKLFIYFTALALVISGLGVFGLVLFMVEQKTKEIGIRKILGATYAQLVFIFSSVFSKRVLIALIISTPATIMLMNTWLENFAYRTSIKPIHFVLAGGMALVIALSTVSFHAIKAAIKNPVDTLKYE
jgi:putative ABC transport system permease protein